jgi:hypothetical protein
LEYLNKIKIGEGKFFINIILLNYFLKKKINYFLNSIVSDNTAIQQYEFCRIHYGEGKIIPHGIEKGYPLNVDFINLPDRILNMKPELFKIIKGLKYSEFRVNAVKRINQMGKSKANNPIMQMNYFESLQVSLI